MRLLELREEEFLKQEDVAKSLKENRSTYANWESEQDEAPLDIYDSLALFYNVSLAYLFGLSNVRKTYLKYQNIDYDKLLENANNFKSKNKLSYSQIAESIGTSKTNIFNYLKGNYKMKAYILIGLVAISGDDIDMFAGRIIN